MDHISLSKLAQKADQGKVDLDNATLAELAKSVAAVAAQRDKMEAAARKMGIAIKRGDAPDTAAYAKPRDKMITLAKSLQRSTKTYAGVLKVKTKLCKGDPKAAKLAADVDKQIDDVDDALADLIHAPESGELILAMLRGHKVEKRDEKDKDKDGDIPIKRAASADSSAPGSGFLAEINFFKTKVPSLELKGVLKHEKDIKDWDLGPQLMKNKRDALRTLSDHLKELQAKNRSAAAGKDAVKDAKDEKKEIATARNMTDLTEDVLTYIAKAQESAGHVRVVTTALQKLRSASPREASAIESLTASMKKTERVIDASADDLKRAQRLCKAVMTSLD